MPDLIRVDVRGSGSCSVFTPPTRTRRSASLPARVALEGNPVDGLRWTPRAADLTREIRRELDKARGLPEVRWVESGSAGQNPPGHSASPESEREQEPIVADAIAALHGLGFSEAQARERTLRAWSRLEKERREGGSRELDAGCLIKEALRR